jgi:hypothetical protein
MTNTINKKILLVVTLLLVLITAGILINNNRHQLSVSVIKSGNGWGYDILKGKRIIIHQPYMPGISGEVAFTNKNSAKKTGLLVVKKIKKKELPTIDPDELNEIIKNTD